MAQQDEQMQGQGLTSRIGIIEINWPQTVGYYGGIGLALAAELIEPPIALFIAAIPVFKMLSHPVLPRPARLVGQVLEGAAKPVGGSDEAAIHLVEASPQSRQSPQPPPQQPEPRLPPPPQQHQHQHQHQQQQPEPRRATSIWREARTLADRRRLARVQPAPQ